MLATILMVASAAILFVAGVLHLKATFFDCDLLPRDPALQKRMREVSPVITQETDMWSCWIGFNAGLSMGFMLYGLVYGFLAISHGSLLFGSPYLLVVGLLMAGGYVALSKAYMFGFPLVITSLSLACYVAGVIVSLA